MTRIWLLLILLSSGLAQADDSGYGWATPTLETTKEGHVLAKFADGKTAQLMISEYVGTVETHMTVSSNTCMPVQSASCVASFQFHRYTLAWFLTDGSDVLYYPNQPNAGELAGKVRAGVGVEFAYNSQGYFPVDQRVGHLKCNRTDMFPWPKANPNFTTVRYIDHDFENENSELMSAPGSSDSPRTNMIRARWSEVPFKRIDKNHVDLLYTDQQAFLEVSSPAPFVAYRLIFDFVAKNLLEPDDRECSVTFNNDFSKTFALLEAMNFPRSKEEILKLNMKPFVKTELNMSGLDKDAKRALVLGWDVSL